MMNNEQKPQLTIPRVIGCLSILVGCEESQAVCIELRKLGHEAYSCDLYESSGGHPEWHLQMDVFEAIKLKKWDASIFFPTCTYLTNAGTRHFSRRINSEEKVRAREKLRDEAADFFMKLVNADIPKIAIENPVGWMNTQYRKPDQIIHPYYFGDDYSKRTCLWLKGLPKLEPTNIVGKGERTTFASGKSHPKWYADALKNAKTKEERQTLRSKTFPGIAEAFAVQWVNYLS